MKKFTKRTFTLPLLAESAGAAALHLPVLVRAMVRPRLPVALREEIMLAVTRVNDCRYCAWVHTGLALANGVDMQELQELLDENTTDADTSAAVAVLFGQHFADQVRRPSKAAKQKLQEHFAAADRREIMAYIHAIYFANLTGNSADAILARLQGREVDSSLLPDMLAAILGAPVLTLIWLNSKRPGKALMQTL